MIVNQLFGNMRKPNSLHHSPKQVHCFSWIDVAAVGDKISACTRPNGRSPIACPSFFNLALAAAPIIVVSVIIVAFELEPLPISAFLHTVRCSHVVMGHSLFSEPFDAGVTNLLALAG